MFKSHIKLMVLKQLSNEKLSGYGLMKSIGELGKKPSPGYIYPLLKDLEKKDFISVKKESRKKVYSITQKGKKLLESLETNKEEMLKSMMRILEPIAEKKEIDRFMKLKSDIKKENHYLQDEELLEKLRNAIFSCYKNPEKRNKIKIVLEETIRKLGKLR